MISRNLCVCVCACMPTCMCVYVCVKGILSLILKYVIPIQLSLKIFFLNRGKIRLLSIHPCFSIWGQGRPPFFSTKILVSWKPQEEQVRAKCQCKLPKLILTHVRLMFFSVLGLRTNQKKTSKLNWGNPRQRFIMGTKIDLS